MNLKKYASGIAGQDAWAMLCSCFGSWGKEKESKLKSYRQTEVSSSEVEPQGFKMHNSAFVGDITVPKMKTVRLLWLSSR